jgi:hypothetical protein
VQAHHSPSVIGGQLGRANAARITISATLGFAAKLDRMACATAASTGRRASGLKSRDRVAPSKAGSASQTDTTAVRPALASWPFR